ncbi:LolA family protein [Geothermobacter hydrogeniphilus]|uniref:LolA family protein n=1 Tax=Geothermobacter hydrogeniphilus TaxID=1969733 RepID=UPI0013047F02|nr:outer membrane lipoprotein carrier protein LolA [Geothermobacter hydrogeniphilus]
MILLLMLCGFTLPAVAIEDLPAVLARIRQAATGVQSLESDFIQEKDLAMFATTIRSRGHLAFMRERRLRWELLEPSASGFVLDGEHGRRWHNLQGKDERFDINDDPLMAAISGQLLAWFRADFTWLQQQFRIELLDTDPVRLVLHPLGDKGPLQQIEITFAADDRSITRVELTEPDGDSTRLVFEHTRINPTLDSAQFR